MVVVVLVFVLVPSWVPSSPLSFVFVLVPVLVLAAVIVCIPIVPASFVLPCRRCLYLLSVFVAALVIVILTVIIIVARLRQPAVVEIARKHFGCESSLCKPTHGPICIPVFAKKKSVRRSPFPLRPLSPKSQCCCCRIGRVPGGCEKKVRVCRWVFLSLT